jgi:hypothetical protein
MSADITSGAFGAIKIKGDLDGSLTGRNFGAISITGGDLSGTITSLTSPADLKKTSAVASLTISGGDLTGDVRLHGALGALKVTPSKTGTGGNITDATIVAAKLASITVGRAVGNSVILAGADLGSDFALGGGNDTFAAGQIGAIHIGPKHASGNVVTNSLIGAGFSSTDGLFKNGDDAIVGATSAERLVSTIASITLTGQADAGSYFAAGKFVKKPVIAGTPITPTADPRFLGGS